MYCVCLLPSSLKPWLGKLRRTPYGHSGVIISYLLIKAIRNVLCVLTPFITENVVREAPTDLVRALWRRVVIISYFHIKAIRNVLCVLTPFIPETVLR